MIQRFKVILSVSSLCVLAWACGRFDVEDGRDLVKRVGEERIRLAAESLRPRSDVASGASGCSDIPRASWPEALRELEPKSICIDANGLNLVKTSFYVEAEGLYIVFKGATQPGEKTGDPSYERIADQIYWFQNKG
jgi:hypothetical protein